MKPDEIKPDVSTIGAMTEGDLRRLIREEMSAQMKDIPTRSDVNALIDRRVEAVEQKAALMVQGSEDRSMKRMDAVVSTVDHKISGLQQRIDGISDNLKTLSELVKSIDQKISQGQRSMDDRMQALAKSHGVIDARLDLLEPKLKANSEAIFGANDGVPGMRNQVNTLALNMGTMREGLGDINRWMAKYDAMAQQRQKQIERVFAMVNSWYVRLFVVLIVASLLDQTVTDIVKLVGGF